MRKPKANKSTEAGAPEIRDGAITPGQRSLMFKAQVLALLGDPSYSTVWEWMRAGLFPLPIELGPRGGRSSTIAWYADEIHDWIANRPRRKLGQHEFRGRSAAEQIDTSQQRRREPKQRRAEGAHSNTE
jgi:predicted DNA-binding transcriptional regulator AlpA